MNFSSPPSSDDLAVMVRYVLETLPDELVEKAVDLKLAIEEFPDEATEQDMELGSSYELLALYHSGKEITPGVEKKIANHDDVLTIFRRPILDLWCETGEDLSGLLREVVIEEISRAFDYSEDDIIEMMGRHHQGMF
ncbi:MAG TPA: metallopeptidase family protein [Alphaproteobacteria bacterium]|nr:metallopeptidase family protein [Alphaproteobacteria bacterium]